MTTHYYRELDEVENSQHMKDLRKAYREGQDSVADRDAENPYDHHDGSYDHMHRMGELADSWEEGRADAEEEMGDEFAQFMDPSMRDLYE